AGSRATTSSRTRSPQRSAAVARSEPTGWAIRSASEYRRSARRRARSSSHSQMAGNRRPALLLLVVDQLDDFDEGDSRTHAVQTGNKFGEFVVEESARELLGVPQIHVDGAAVRLVDGKGFLAEPRHGLETPTSLTRNCREAGRIKVVSVLELHNHTLHLFT